MTTFTPGPWAVNGSAIETNRDHGIEYLAHISDDIQEGNSDSNANLIAAAPDLYAAVLALLEPAGESPATVRAQARAALRKAQGRT